MSDVKATKSPSISKIWRNGLLGIALSVVINAILYLVGSTFTFPPDALTPIGTPVTIAPVIITTAIGGIMATVGYTILTRVLSTKLSNRVMVVGAILVLIGMFFTPFGIENVPVAQIVILEIMHLVAGVIPVAMLIRQ